MNRSRISDSAYSRFLKGSESFEKEIFINELKELKSNPHKDALIWRVKRKIPKLKLLEIVVII